MNTYKVNTPEYWKYEAEAWKDEALNWQSKYYSTSEGKNILLEEEMKSLNHELQEAYDEIENLEYQMKEASRD